jgi:hypothetical protein
MDFKKFSKDLDRQNYFKNIALMASQYCLKTFDSDEVSEEEEKCLKSVSKNLHLIMERGKLDKYIIGYRPPQSY